MKSLIKTLTLAMTLIFLFYVNSSNAQGHHHGGGYHGMWPDSLEKIAISGTTIVDSTQLIPKYYEVLYRCR